MSFILDALKKSENERQRQIGPSLADLPMRRTREDRPWWAFAVAALLLVNLIVLLVVLLRDKPAPSLATPPSAPTGQAQPIAPPAVAPAATPSTALAAQPAPTRANPAVQSLAEAAGTNADGEFEEVPYEPSVASAAVVPEGPPVVRPIDGPMVTPNSDQPAFAARDRAGSVASQDAMLPTHGGLVASGVRLPDMRLDIHVFSPAPRDRFVFVNMRKYVEGQTLTEGPLLERITPDGAVFDSNGTRFMLPRQ